MPTPRRNRLSETPGDMTGTTGTDGHICPATFSIAPMTSGRIGDGGLGCEAFTRVSVTFSPAREARVRSTAVRAVSGTTSGEYPAADPGALAQTVKGVGNAGVFATLDANARVETLTEIEKLVLLRQVPMFAELAPDHLEELAAVVVERHFQPGADLCREGDAGDAVFLLVKGKVKVFTGGADGRPERVLSELGPGACIGEMAVFDAAPRSATVRAVERTRALTLPGGDFKGLLSERAEMSQVIIAELVRRMRGLMAK